MFVQQCTSEMELSCEQIRTGDFTIVLGQMQPGLKHTVLELKERSTDHQTTVAIKGKLSRFF